MRLMAIFAAGVLSVTSMGGIVTVHAGEALAVPADEAGVVQTDGRMLRQQKMAVWQLLKV